MKLTAIILFVVSLHVSATTYSQTLNFSGRNVPLEKVFTAIKAQTGFLVFYNETDLKDARPVSLESTGQPLRAVLDTLLGKQGLSYVIQNKTIIVSKTVQVQAVLMPVADTTPKQEAVLNGSVYDDKMEPLPGATVINKSTGKGTSTDVRGRFTLKDIPPGTVLQVTFIGYNKLEYKVSASDNYITLRMKAATSMLDEKVVKAYGTTSQRYTTGNISTVSGEQIARQPVMNPLMALQGLVPGMVITPNSNAYPSAAVKVEIRGRNSLNANLPSDPLYVIDGVPLTILQVGTSNGAGTSYANGSTGYLQNNMIAGLNYGGSSTTGQSPLFNINPQDIESISVLKDADATSLYGARAANGVILITTKHGQAGPTRFNVNINSGTSFITRYWDMLNTSQYLDMRRKAFANSNVTPTAVNAPDLLIWDTTRNTNWQKYLWGNLGQVTSAHASLSGGDTHTTFLIGGGYSSQNDITKASGHNQLISANISLNHSSKDSKLNIGLAINYGMSDVNAIQVNAAGSLPPDAPPIYDAKGNLNFAGWSSLNFPFSALRQPYENKTTTLNGSLRTAYTIIKGLTASVTLGYNSAAANQTATTPIASQNPATNPKGTIVQGRNDNSNTLIDPQLDYSALLGKGRLTATLGGSLQTTITEGLGISGTGIASDAQMGTITNATTFTTSDNYGKQKVASVFASAGYNWDGKYVISLNGRRDGNTNFAPDNRFGSFGSVGLAWLLSEETWMKNILPSAISLVKFRGSYGTTGGSASTPFAYMSQWSSSGFGNAPYTGVQTTSPQLHADPAYHWEVDKQLDLGMTLGFAHDRITFTSTYYRKRCDNQLTSLPTPVFTGFSSVVGNSPANVQNSGVELVINANIISTKKFNWQAAFNISKNWNKLISFPNFAQSSYTATYIIGKPLNFVPLFKYTGVDPQTGSYTYVDHDKDGKIQANYSVPLGTDDRYVILYTDPKFFGGMFQSFSYGGVTLSASFYFKKQMNRNAQWGSNPGSSLSNISQYVYDNTWRQPGDKALFSKFVAGYDPNNSAFGNSTAVWTDASFVRLSNLTLSYTLPAALLKKAAWLKGLTFNVNSNNLFTITKFKGIDPEVGSFGNLPPARIITAGLNCSF